MAEMKYTRPAALIKIERILALLTERPRTAYELAAALPMSKRHAQGYLNHLMATKSAHIKRWVRDVDHSERMYPRPVYAAGAGKNARQPNPLTPAQRNVRAWERIKEDENRHLNHTMRRRIYRISRMAPRADQAAAWMYGKAE